MRQAAAQLRAGRRAGARGQLHRFADEPFAFGQFRKIGGSVSVPPAKRFRFGLHCAGGIGAAAIVNKYVAARREQLAADSETNTLGAGSDEGALAVEFMHGESEKEGKNQACMVA